MFEDSDNNNNTDDGGGAGRFAAGVVTHQCYENGTLVEPINPIEGVNQSIDHASQVIIIIILQSRPFKTVTLVQWTSLNSASHFNPLIWLVQNLYEM